MSADTITASTPATTPAPAKNGKPKSSKPAAKGKPKTKTAKATKLDRSAADEPANVRRTKLIQLLRKMKATASGSARPISELAAKLGYTPYDVYCLGYEKYKLFQEGYLKHTSLEGSRETYFYLTAKGAKLLPE